MLEVFQTQPRLVFSCNDIVYKYFDQSIECEEEIISINSSPLVSKLDHRSGYNMKFVEILTISENFYTMKKVTGLQLTDSRCSNHYRLAGRWLKTFHCTSQTDDYKDVFAFGDYSISHLYVNDEDKEVVAIDPGKSFGKISSVEDDVSRFIVSLLQTKNLNLMHLNDNVSQFIDAYGHESLDFPKLTTKIQDRITTNYLKRIQLGVGPKRYMSAYLWWIISNLKMLFIRNNLY